MSALGNRLQGSPKPLKIIALLLLLVLLLLLAVLAFLQFKAPESQPAPVPTETEVTAVSPTQAVALDETTTPTAMPKATHTPVVTAEPEVEIPEESTSAAPSPSPGVEILEEPAASPSSTPLTPVSTPSNLETVRTMVAADNALHNGDFDLGFQTNGVAQGWDNFNNSSAEFGFQPGDWPRINEGNAQFISIRNAEIPDRYLGIYQTVNVVSGQPYTFSVRGLIRTGAGDVGHTDFGYRMQIGFDFQGGQNWKEVKEWTELSWDEQIFTTEDPRIDEYTTSLKARSDKLTVFVRAWKKWADPGEGVYDVVSAHLQGPTWVVRQVEQAPKQEPVDAPVQIQTIPVTGEGTPMLGASVHVWISVTLLLFLLGGAVWRLRWKQK